MLRQQLKIRTHSNHQKTEGIIIRRIKAVRCDSDYIEILKEFYSYFTKIEKELSKYININVLPDLEKRRNSNDIQKDIEKLGGNLEQLPPAKAPSIHNIVEALSAMYVLEGSIMGGPYIVKMLKKQGITTGFSFFNGYGDNSQKMFEKFVKILDYYGEQLESFDEAIQKADETFIKFGEVFSSPVPEHKILSI